MPSTKTMIGVPTNDDIPAGADEVLLVLTLVASNAASLRSEPTEVTVLIRRDTRTEKPSPITTATLGSDLPGSTAGAATLAPAPARRARRKSTSCLALDGVQRAGVLRGFAAALDVAAASLNLIAIAPPQITPAGCHNVVMLGENRTLTCSAAEGRARAINSKTTTEKWRAYLEDLDAPRLRIVSTSSVVDEAQSCPSSPADAAEDEESNKIAMVHFLIPIALLVLLFVIAAIAVVVSRRRALSGAAKWKDTFLPRAPTVLTHERRLALDELTDNGASVPVLPGDDPRLVNTHDLTEALQTPYYKPAPPYRAPPTYKSVRRPPAYKQPPGFNPAEADRAYFPTFSDQDQVVAGEAMYATASNNDIAEVDSTIVTTTTTEDFSEGQLQFPKSRAGSPPPFISPPSYSDSGVPDDAEFQGRPAPQGSLDAAYMTHAQVVAQVTPQLNAVYNGGPGTARRESSDPGLERLDSECYPEHTAAGSGGPLFGGARPVYAVDTTTSMFQAQRNTSLMTEMNQRLGQGAGVQSKPARSSKAMRTALVDAAKSMADEVGDTTDSINTAHTTNYDRQASRIASASASIKQNAPPAAAAKEVHKDFSATVSYNLGLQLARQNSGLQDNDWNDEADVAFL